MTLPISPDSFVDRMEQRWVEQLGNASSENLKAIWRQLGEVFGAAIEAQGGPEEKTWRVLQPPTGTGKTQGLCVYAAMVGERNSEVEDDRDKIGVLVVTRLIDQCEEIAGLVNELAGGAPVALARHSEARATSAEMAQADVLVITHQAYVNAVQHIGSDEDDRWDRYISWRHGQRKLTVIDEALANMVEEHQLTSSSVSQTLGNIPQETKLEFPSQIAALKAMNSIFGEMAKEAAERPEDKLTVTKMVWRGLDGLSPASEEVWGDNPKSLPPELSMKGLRSSLSSHHYDRSVLGKNSVPDRHRLRDRVDDTLAALQAVMANWGYYAKSGSEQTINYASLVIPDDGLPGPVVLDATATQNFLWELFKDHAEVFEAPANARTYGNVTLHVARGLGIGKAKMMERHKERLPRLLDSLQDKLCADRKVFLCCQLGVEPFAKTFEPRFKRYEVGHWGAIDGRNDWKDCDVVVLFGLSYRGQEWANNAFMAFQGRQETEWLIHPVFKHHVDVRREMQERQIAVSVIQAINRVQCRKVIDGQGNCATTDAFIVLPRDRIGDAVLAAIKLEMPGILVAAWEFDLDTQSAKTPSVRKGSSHEAILSYMRSQPPGEYPIAQLKAALEIKDSTWKEGVAPALRDSKHPLSVGLGAEQVTYVAGRGRRANSRLVKR